MASKQHPKNEKGKGGFHFDQGTDMPYRYPRGATMGSRAGLYIAEIVCVLLFIAMIAAIFYMGFHTYSPLRH
ncbi:MAG TPA: hypothetical protein VHU80_01520 [Polyangiaceae bacterium]|nr:hypothetical protein [Polyangiaceae bacterium]